jgi:hypothetical protein
MHLVELRAGFNLVEVRASFDLFEFLWSSALALTM